MEQRTLEINLISAKDLKDVNLFSKMDVYVVVSISGDPHQPINNNQKTKTPVSNGGGTNPIWNFPAKFTVDEAPAQQNRLNLDFQLRCERALGDKDIGEVNVPIKELLDSIGDGKTMQFVSFQVRKPSGKPQGELNFSFKFSDKVVSSESVHKLAEEEPVTAYPAPPPPIPIVGSSTATTTPYGAVPGYYPPPQAYAVYPPPGYAGYPPPPPPGYGYPPPPPPGCGYAQGPPGYPPPVQQAQKKKNKFGMGLGAGLLGGALGGLLIGDMVSHGGCDSGFDGGF